ncbi:MAG: hypothetical protein DMG13_23180 [Acidobacteria bacterium]|nr:MAG: hypothetical protein DMG13_23180 [Acidobacteriota bacterium]
MLFAAEIVFEPQVIALIVDETRLPIPRVILRIVNGDEDDRLVLSIRQEAAVNSDARASISHSFMPRAGAAGRRIALSSAVA